MPKHISAQPTDGQPFTTVTVRIYAKIYKVSRQTVYNWLASGKLQGAVIDGVQHIFLHLHHTPPIGYPGNPKFADPAFQRQLAQRPRPGRKKPN